MNRKPVKPRHVRIRPLRHLRKPLCWIWGSLIFGVVLNLPATWLTTPRWDMRGTPLGWIIDHPVPPLFIAGVLSILLLLALVASAQEARQTKIIGQAAGSKEKRALDHSANPTSPGIPCPNCGNNAYRLYSNRGPRKTYECLHRRKNLTISYDGPNIIKIAIKGLVALESAELIHGYLQHHSLLGDVIDQHPGLDIDFPDDFFS